jgi:hypothetical protein
MSEDLPGLLEIFRQVPGARKAIGQLTTGVAGGPLQARRRLANKAKRPLAHPVDQVFNFLGFGYREE